MKSCTQAGRVARVLRWFGVLILMSGASGRALALQSLWCSWDPSSSPEVVNYNIYYWQAGGTVTNRLGVGDVTTAEVPGLLEGATYGFVLTANTADGLESAPSGQITYTVPSPLTLQMQFVPSGNGVAALFITATGDVPAQWALEGSTDLLNWADCATGTNTAVNFQTRVATVPQMFFRLKAL
jgi:hypothetical protein